MDARVRVNDLASLDHLLETSQVAGYLLARLSAEDFGERYPQSSTRCDIPQRNKDLSAAAAEGRAKFDRSFAVRFGSFA